MQSIIYKVILIINLQIHILDISVNKFNGNKNYITLKKDTSQTIQGYYTKNCLKQSNKGNCIICKDQFKNNGFNLA